MKRMLINATHSEEIRVALADGQKLYNLDIDVPGQERKKGNIYKGRITRVEPSLEAAFVDYGANRHGFLPYKEISRNYYTDAANKMKERPPIAVAVKEGTEVIIQVNKEERGNKGAAISTYISLAGRYLVYMPENPKAGGISRRIEGKARQDLKNTLSNVKHPKNSGVIVRTAGIGRTSEELEWDLNYLDQVWTAIKTVSVNRKAPFFIYQESDIFIRALRDYLRPDVSEILIDNKEIYEKARDFMQQVMPHNLKKLSYYNDTIPLFSRYQIESQIQSAFSREVHLPSGGSLVIDHTEAMISIDINSARATKGADIEETALNTNLEAADEIARQLRIRDLGGLVVIDFIDMRNHKNQRSVEQQLTEAVSNDRARIQTSKISRFGLLEMSRQRLKSSINESSQFACPRCSGHGFIRNIESLSVSILRIMEEEALKLGTGKVIAQVPTKVANFIINEKREELNSLEARHSVPMLIVANEFYQSPQFDIQRLKKSEADKVDVNTIALNKPESEEQAENKSSQMSRQPVEKAAVDVVAPQAQAPARVEETDGFVGWLKSLFTSNATKTTAKKPQTRQQIQQKTNKTTSPKKPQHKKPQHPNQKNKQQNKAQPQKSQAPKKGQVSKTQTTNTQNKKPEHKNQAQKEKQVPQQVPNQNKKPLVKNQPKTKPVTAKPQQAVAQKTTQNTEEDPSIKGQILQRPLGSVASYAANKAKQETVDNSKVKAIESPKTNNSEVKKQETNKPNDQNASQQQKERVEIKTTTETKETVQKNKEVPVTKLKSADITPQATANKEGQTSEQKSTSHKNKPKKDAVKAPVQKKTNSNEDLSENFKDKKTPLKNTDNSKKESVNKASVKKAAVKKKQSTKKISKKTDSKIKKEQENSAGKTENNPDSTPLKAKKEAVTKKKATRKKASVKKVTKDTKAKPESKQETHKSESTEIKSKDKPAVTHKPPSPKISKTDGGIKPESKPEVKKETSKVKAKETPVKDASIDKEIKGAINTDSKDSAVKKPAKNKKPMPDPTSGIDFDI